MQGVNLLRIVSVIALANLNSSAREILELQNVENCTFHIQNFEMDTAVLEKILHLNQYRQPWTISSGSEARDKISEPRYDFTEICDINIFINATDDVGLSASRVNRMTSIFLFIYHGYDLAPFVYSTSAHIYFLCIGGEEEEHQIFKYCNTCNGSGDWIQLQGEINRNSTLTEPVSISSLDFFPKIIRRSLKNARILLKSLNPMKLRKLAGNQAFQSNIHTNSGSQLLCDLEVFQYF
jgi:hypothetical protein